MIHEWRTPLPVRTPKGDADCLAIIDYGYNVNTVWLCRMHGTGQVLHFDSADVVVYGNPMDGRGWDVNDGPSIAATPADLEGSVRFSGVTATTPPASTLRRHATASPGGTVLGVGLACPLALLPPAVGSGLYCHRHGEVTRPMVPRGAVTTTERCHGCVGSHLFLVEGCTACLEERERQNYGSDQRPPVVKIPSDAEMAEAQRPLVENLHRPTAMLESFEGASQDGKDIGEKRGFLRRFGPTGHATDHELARMSRAELADYKAWLSTRPSVGTAYT